MVTKNIVFYSFIIFSLMYLSSCSLFSPKAKQDDTLVVGTSANYAPFEYLHNGKLAGFDIDLMNKLAEHLNKKIIWKDLAFDALILQAQLGSIDIIAAAMTPTPERSNQLLFTQPHLANDPLVVITRISDLKPTTLADLKGKEVIVNDGYTAASFMESQKGVVLKKLPTVADAFLALTSGRAYAFVSALSSVQSFFDQYGQKEFNVLRLDVHETYAFAVPKTNQQLYIKIQQALKSLEADGTMLNLKKKWHLIW